MGSSGAPIPLQISLSLSLNLLSQHFTFQPPPLFYRYYIVNHGLSVHKQCSAWGDAEGCALDSDCVWTSDAVCTPSVCTAHCTADLCTAETAATCSFDHTTQRCSGALCEHTTTAECESDPACWWDTFAEAEHAAGNLCKPAVGCHGHKEKHLCVVQSMCTWDSEQLKYVKRRGFYEASKAVRNSGNKIS